jgi:hypothetical protein
VTWADGRRRSGVRRFAERQEACAWIEEDARRRGAEFVCEEQQAAMLAVSTLQRRQSVVNHLALCC